MIYFRKMQSRIQDIRGSYSEVPHNTHYHKNVKKSVNPIPKEGYSGDPIISMIDPPYPIHSWQTKLSLTQSTDHHQIARISIINQQEPFDNNR